MALLCLTVPGRRVDAEGVQGPGVVADEASWRQEGRQVSAVDRS